MTSRNSYKGYDQLAWFYNRHWGTVYHWQAFRILDSIFLKHLPIGARILDLCCGTGHITRLLIEKGYDVVGIDGSMEMLRYAIENAPRGMFLQADARRFVFSIEFDGILSTFESLNHILNIKELTAVFRNCFDALRPGGALVFDLIMEEAYLTQWGKSHAIVDEDNVCIIRGGYDAGERVARSEITMFCLQEHWERYDVTLLQRYHGSAWVVQALERVGFKNVVIRDAITDFGMTEDLGTGRLFFTALKPDHC